MAMMSTLGAALSLGCLLSLHLAAAQQPGHQKTVTRPVLATQTCTTAGGCTPTTNNVQLDSNWMWVHKKGDYHNCFTGNAWDSTLCPDPDTCAQNCALDPSDYSQTYGVSSSGDALTIKLVTKTQYGTNVGARTYLMDDGGSTTQYKMFQLLNKEFTVDIDDSQLPCGTNGALYFVEMDQDGGMSKYPNNNAGAAYGTGYCDAQCPHDLKFINGAANTLDWQSSGPSTGTGKYGTCCVEMDIWEGNAISEAVTPHPCQVSGQTRCEGIECGDNGADRYKGVCDKDGGGFAPYRLGDTNFWGSGSNFAVDSSQKTTVVTQFISSDGTDTGDLVEIRRLYVQNGNVIQTRNVTVNGKSYDSITDEFVNATKIDYKTPNAFAEKGGMKQMGEALKRGMVLVMSLWDDAYAHMLWLDSDYPTNEPASKPGVARGTCATTSGVPSKVEADHPDANVVFSNIKFGDIGSTYRK